MTDRDRREVTVGDVDNTLHYILDALGELTTVCRNILFEMERINEQIRSGKD